VPALAAVVAAMGRGELTPEEARAVVGVLEVQRKAIETAELEARVAALEDCVPGAGG
jgi:polyhydroxyalkanoate synthesis regulator phasin